MDGQKEGLLHKEIKHLGDLVQILSYELTVLYDFVKENYGPSFDSFREEHLKSQPHQLSRKLLQTNRTPSKTATTKQRIIVNKNELSDSERMSESGTEDVYPTQPPGFAEFYMHDFADTSGMEVENDSDVDDDDMSNTVVSRHEENRVKRGTKKKSSIWRKYIVSFGPDGKCHAECRSCRSRVSAKVERLRAHYVKCSGSPSTNEAEMDKLRVMKAMQDDKKVTEGASRQARSFESPARTNNDGGDALTSTSRSSHGHHGRKPDPIWAYFKIQDDPDGKKRPVICKRCNVEVSNKVERVRRHFSLCNELDKVEESPPPDQGKNESIS